jgi:hypothetical protein
MYAGTTLHTKSGNVIGGHQKIDRLARRTLKKLTDKPFPRSKDILYFEGNNGPDGIKRKSPSQDEPWHFYDPQNPEKGELLTHIDDHLFNLVRALKEHNDIRVRFEAAWLAHTIVDGLTPAHHYPLEEKIEELFGMSKDERQTVIDKNFIRGRNRRDTLSKNWQYWGKKGIFMTHFMFEIGVAMAITPIRVLKTEPSGHDLDYAREQGFAEFFKKQALAVEELGLYETFGRDGWNRQFALAVRRDMLPIIVNTVAIGWLTALEDAKR